MLNSEKVGYKGAELLDLLMRRRNGVEKTRCLLIPPSGIAARRSTDVLAIDDPLVARVARAIRERAWQGITVEDLLAEFRISRSVFYQRFHHALGRSPHHEILRVQLDRVQNLLRQTRLPLKTIAEMSGFSDPNYLNVAFKREMGLTPGEYRERHNGK